MKKVVVLAVSFGILSFTLPAFSASGGFNASTPDEWCAKVLASVKWNGLGSPSQDAMLCLIWQRLGDIEAKVEAASCCDVVVPKLDAILETQDVCCAGIEPDPCAGLDGMSCGGPCSFQGVEGVCTWTFNTKTGSCTCQAGGGSSCKVGCSSELDCSAPMPYCVDGCCSSTEPINPLCSRVRCESQMGVQQEILCQSLTKDENGCYVFDCCEVGVETCDQTTGLCVLIVP